MAFHLTGSSGPDATEAPTLSPGPADLQNPLGEACLLRELLQVLGVGVVVNGKVRLHGPKLVVLEGGAHALRLLAARVWLVSVQVLRVVLVTAQGWGGKAEAEGEPPGPPSTPTTLKVHTHRTLRQKFLASGPLCGCRTPLRWRYYPIL